MDPIFNQTWVLVTYAILFCLTIPWYWPKSATQLIWGFPLWSFVNILGSFVIALFTAFLLIKAIKRDSHAKR